MAVRGKIHKISYGQNLQMSYYVGQKLHGEMEGAVICAIVRNLNYFNRTGNEWYQIEVKEGNDEPYVWQDVINMPCVPQNAKPTADSTNIYNGEE
jgi:hypothetical protein